MRRSSVALIGFMCAGKSSVGRVLAERRRLDFIETDAVIEERAGMPIADIFESKGEDAFRQLETEVVRDVSGRGNAIIACGGGVPLREENVGALRKGAVVVYLDVSAEHVIRRLGPPSTVRPLLSGSRRQARARKLLSQRRPVYLAAADIVVDSDERTVQEVADEILRLLNEYERTHS